MPVAGTSSVSALPQRRWEVQEADTGAVSELERGLGVLPTTARVLVVRGLVSLEAAQAFLEPTLDRLNSPFCFSQMEAAVDRVLHAVDKGERIVVHGDYDVDGVTGTVVLVTALRAVGGDVDYVIPHRMHDGYGLKVSGADRAHELGAEVLVAVDCGITANAAAERACELGIDLIIADHHQPGPEIPPATAILNPHLPDAGYPENDLAAVAVAFQLARGVLQRHEKELRGTSLIKLVAIGTVADLVPLTGENRIIAHYGLKTLLEAVNPGLRALLDVSGLRRAPISAGDVAFRLAPRINAAGRLGDASEAVEMFLTADPGRARRIAHRLHLANTQRRAVEAEVLDAALQQRPADEDTVVVAAGDGWHRGVIGIVASRLVERWGRPAVVIGVEGDQAYGSARSVPGFNIVGALGQVSGLIDEYGGHHQAAGLQMRADAVGDLREALADTGTDELEEALRRYARLQCDAELRVDDSLAPLAYELERLAPFGVGNRRPRFLCRDLHLTEAAAVLKDEHLKLRVDAGDTVVDAVGWRKAGLAEHIGDRRRIDAVATVRVRRWGGRLRPELELVEIRVPDDTPLA